LSSKSVTLTKRSTAALMQAAHAALGRQIFRHIVAVGFSDLRPSHGRVLEHLTHEDGLMTRTLAELAGMTAQSMGELVDELERLGYVQRRPDARDRRAKRVFLTERGQANVQASGDIVRRIEARLRRDLGRDYLRMRAAMLRIIQADD
jgi:DNA-binding MarR family transcriptional regulator